MAFSALTQFLFQFQKPGVYRGHTGAFQNGWVSRSENEKNCNGAGFEDSNHNMPEESIHTQLGRILQLLEKQEHCVHPDPAAQVVLSLVPIIGILAGAVVLIIFIRYFFEMRRQMIQSGRMPGSSIRYLRSIALLGGILSTAAGLPLTLLFLAIEGVAYPLLGGLIPLFAGIGLLVFFVLSRSSESRESDRT